MAYRYAVVINGEMITTTAIYTDPFTGMLWLGRCHTDDRPMLNQLVPHDGIASIWLLSRDPERKSRSLTYEYDGVFAAPIDLDCSTDELAMEWVGLKNVDYLTSDDVRTEDVPEGLKKVLLP